MLQLKFVLKRKPKKNIQFIIQANNHATQNYARFSIFLYKIYLLESENYKTMRSWYSVRKYRIRATIIFF